MYFISKYFPLQNIPGKFLLSYLPRVQCRHEYIKVLPDGFQFRGQIFGKVADLIKWFKEHFRDPLPGQATPSTPRGMMSTRTPYHTPGGASGMFKKWKLNYIFNYIYFPFRIKH